jgi:hypothetical protein
VLTGLYAALPAVYYTAHVIVCALTATRRRL